MHGYSSFPQINRRLGQPAINIYTDKDSGKPKGDATLSYEEPFCAKAAVEHFDGRFMILFIYFFPYLFCVTFLKYDSNSCFCFPALKERSSRAVG